MWSAAQGAKILILLLLVVGVAILKAQTKLTESKTSCVIVPLVLLFHAAQ